MLGSLRNRVLHFKLYGHIDAKMTEKVHQAFKGKSLYNVQMIGVSINSGGGSIVQAKNIVSALKHFSRKSSAPIYCFAEDLVLNSANVILASGNKVYANKYSLIGDFGYNFRQFGLKDFIKDWKVDQAYIASGDRKIKLNQFEDLKPEDAQWSQRFDELKLTNDDINQKLFGSGVMHADEMVKLGLVDGIDTLDNISYNLFHGVKVLDAIKKSFWVEELSMVANFTQ